MNPGSKDQMRAFLEQAAEAYKATQRGMQAARSTEYAQALRNIEGRITEAHREMLIGHALAPQQICTMSQLAAIAGYESYRAANLQYGKLAGLLLDALGKPRPRWLVYAIADFDDDPDTAESRAHMHPELYEALQLLGWIPAEPVPLEPDPGPELGGDDGLTVTERQQLTSARIGQGQFRADLLAIWDGRCALTGCNLLPVLIASHIKPWAQSTNAERLDPYNGLLLSSNVDRLFDQGFISFTDSGQMLFKPVVTNEQLAPLGLSRHLELRQVAPQHLPYLKAHRAIHGF